MKRNAGLLGRGCVGILVVALTICSNPGTASGAGFATGGVGIKARAMGGAFRGIADDWSAAAYNPAGLAFMEGNHFNMTLSTYSPQLTYTPSFDVTGSNLDIGFDEINGLEAPPRDNVWPIPSFAGVFVPEEMNGTAFGIAVYWPHDVNYSWDLYRQPPAYQSDFFDDLTSPRENFRTDLDVLDIHPVVARQLSETFAIGAGLSLTNGDLVFRRVQFVENTLGWPFDVYPYNDFVGDLQLEGNGFAVGGNIGMMWKPSETFTLGVSVQSPVTVPLSGRANLDMAWPINAHLANLQINLDVDQDNDNDFDRTVFSGVNDVFTGAPNHTNAPWELDLELPGQIGVGIGWGASERFTLAFDAAITFWSNIADWTFSFGEGGLLDNIDSIPAITSITIPFGWDNQIRLAGGAEYWARDNLTLRTGLYWESGAAVDETFTPLFPDVGDRVGLTGGFSYTINERWAVAAAQEVAFFSDRTVASVDGADGISTFPGDYSLTRYETLVSLGYRF